MDYGGFSLAASGMDRKHGGHGFGVNWQKQAGLLQQIMYFQSSNICKISSQHWLEGESNIFPETQWDFTFSLDNFGTYLSETAGNIYLNSPSK